jgi:hypothetical protein
MSKRHEGEDTAARLGSQSPETPLRSHVRAILLAVLLWASWSAVYAWYMPFDVLSIQVGQPSPRDIKAPRAISYISQVETQAARLAAVARVEAVYDGPDLRIASQQVQALRTLGSTVTELRDDRSLNRASKIEAILGVAGLELTPVEAETIVDLDGEPWDATLQEAFRVVQLVMQQEVRPDGIAAMRRRAKSMATYALNEDQRLVAVALAQPMIVPNSAYDEAATDENRQAALAAVKPIYRQIQEGESILREGEIVSDLAIEQMQVLELLNTKPDWQQIVGLSLLFLIIVALLGLYVARTHSLLLYRPRRELLFVLTLLLVGVAARLSIPGHTILPYLFPTAAAAMLITVLLDVQLGLLTAGISAILVGLNTAGSVELVAYSLIAGLLGSLLLTKLDQLGAFVRAGVYLALVNVALIVGFRLTSQIYDPVGLLQLAVSGVGNAVIAISLTFIAYSFAGRLFGITTSLQLLELARPTHPLFRQVLIQAPGTYHHSIVLSNMAERAADAIGADGLLARVGSYYHDIGKTARPYFFAENQADGENPHDKLDPRTSADIIIAHTTEGMELARKYRLPRGVAAFILEHHGTTRVSYFYRRALADNEGDQVQEQDYCYPGPKPQSRETAIVMLGDSIEAAVRAKRPATQDEMERVIRQIINDRLISGQLDECDLTLSDLDTIRQAFSHVLKGIFHPRIDYPERQRRRVVNGSNGASNGGGARS